MNEILSKARPYPCNGSSI